MPKVDPRKNREQLEREEAYIEKMMARDFYYERRDNTLPKREEVVETWYGPVTVFGPIIKGPK